MALVKKYRQREYADDIDSLSKDFKGINNILLLKYAVGVTGLLEGMRTNMEGGLKSGDEDERKTHFGSNYREPP